MKLKKTPQRKCVICGEHFDKKELVRLVKTKEGDSFYDPTGKANGRGYYLCKHEKCLKKALKHKVIGHILTEDVAEEIKSIMVSRQN